MFMKKLTILLLLGLLVGCADKKPRLSQEELRRIRTQPIVVDIRQSPESSVKQDFPVHNGTINITKYSQTAEEKQYAKKKSQNNAKQLLWGLMCAIPSPPSP